MATASEMIAKWVAARLNARSEWKEWIPSLREYVVSVFQRTGQFPVRAVLTDGDWLVIFENPRDAFDPSGIHDARLIHAFENNSAVADHYDLVFRLLDQRLVSRSAVEVPPGAIAGLIAPSRVVRLFHGLRLRYANSETVGPLIPTISVKPTILLRSDVGSWLRVARDEEFFLMPYEYQDLSVHLQAVREAAQFLLSRVNQQLAGAPAG